jgi:hypothetical protein
MKPPIQLLQERDFGQKINATFEFLGQNFKPLMTAILYIAGPPALIGGIFAGVYQSNMLSMLGRTPTDVTNPFSSLAAVFSVSYLLFILFVVVASLATSLSVYGYVLEYDKRGGSTPTITPTDVWERVKANLGDYVVTSIILFFVLIVATLLLIIPGIYLSVCFSLIFIVIMRENLSFEAAYKRCLYLIQDKWWSTFGLIVVVSIIQSIIGYIFQIPTLIFTVLKAMQVLENSSYNTIFASISGIVGTLGQILTSVLLNLAIVFQYYNLVERRDGAGIIGAIQSIGNAEAPRTEQRED